MRYLGCCHLLFEPQLVSVLGAPTAFDQKATNGLAREANPPLTNTSILTSVRAATGETTNVKGPSQLNSSCPILFCSKIELLKTFLRLNKYQGVNPLPSNLQSNE